MGENRSEATPYWSDRTWALIYVVVGVALFILGNLATVAGWYDGMGFILFVPFYSVGFAFLVASCLRKLTGGPDRIIRVLILLLSLLSVAMTFAYMDRYSTPPVRNFPVDDLASNTGV